MTTPDARVTTTLAITGMTCGHCVSHVESALTGLTDVRARVDLAAATAEVHHSPAVPLAALVAAIEDAGYTAEPSRR